MQSLNWRTRTLQNVAQSSPTTRAGRIMRSGCIVRSSIVSICFVALVIAGMCFV